MRLGVLDIGSKTGHLLVIDAHGGAAPMAAYSCKEPLRLAEQLDERPRVTDKGVEALTGFVSQALLVSGEGLLVRRVLPAAVRAKKLHELAGIRTPRRSTCPASPRTAPTRSSRGRSWRTC